MSKTYYQDPNSRLFLEHYHTVLDNNAALCVALMFSSPLPLCGAAVCQCQRGHRGHGGGHPEDMPERQRPQTWGEQQHVSATQLHRDTNMTGLSLAECSASAAGFLFSHHFSSYLSSQPCRRVTTALLTPLTHLSFSCVFSLLLFLLCNWKFSSSCSSIRWQLVVPQICSKFTGSSCLCGLSKRQALRGIWRRWRSIRAHSQSRRSSWWR